MSEILFHYCSNQAFCSIIESRSIWLSSLGLSNDSMEGRWLRQLFEAECVRESISKYDVPDIMDALDFLIDRTDGLGFCLSEVGDLLSQWRGYAANGEGISLGFRKEYLDHGQEPNGKTPGHKLHKVSYDELSEPENVSKVIDAVKKSSADGAWRRPGLLTAPTDVAGWKALTEKRIAASFPILLLMGDLYKVKNPAFREECEWRLLSLSFRDIDEPRTFRARGDAIIPYRTYPLDIADQPISKVILGPKNKSDAKDILNLLKASGFENIEVVRSSATYR